MTDRECFLWGLLGAVLPEVLRLYQSAVAAVQNGATDAMPGHLPLPYRYFLYSGVFMIFTGPFTVAWTPENRFKAVWVGISFPILVTKLAQVAPSIGN